VLCLAVDKTQAQIVNKYIAGYFNAVPLLKPLKARETADGLELANNVEIVIAASNYRSVRGRTIACAIFDEVAFWGSEGSVSSDVEICNAILPAMITLPDSMLIMITTAYRRTGLVYQKWSQHFGKGDDDVLVIYGPSPAFNPTLPQNVIDAALERDLEAAAAEYLSRWRDDLSGLFDRELVEGAVDRGVVVRPRGAAHSHVARVDVSGGRGDPFALAVAHDEGGTAVLDAVKEWRPPFNLATVVKEASELLRQYGITTLAGDHYGEDWPVEEFARHGIRLVKSELNKSGIYLALLPLLTSGRARLLDVSRMVHQLVSLERRVGRNKDTVDHPDGGHDDLANVAAGALVLAATDAAPSLIRQSDLEAEADVPDGLIYCTFAVLVVDRDGRSGLSYFGAPYPNLDKPLMVIDFGAPPVTATLFGDIAGRLGELSERFRSTKRGKAVRFGLFAPTAFVDVAMLAMQKAFARHDMSVQRYGFCDAYEEWLHDRSLLANPQQLHYAGSVHFGTGMMRFSGTARDRRSTVPVDLGTPLGDRADPLALAILLGPLLRYWG
jgi:hypothetical protein